MNQLLSHVNTAPLVTTVTQLKNTLTQNLFNAEQPSLTTGCEIRENTLKCQCFIRVELFLENIKFYTVFLFECCPLPVFYILNVPSRLLIMSFLVLDFFFFKLQFSRTEFLESSRSLIDIHL